MTSDSVSPLQPNRRVAQLPELLLQPVVRTALEEDIRSGDVTTRALIAPEARAKAHMVFRQSGVACGLDAAQLAFQTLDAGVQVELLQGDGSAMEAGETALRVSGSAAAILTAERVALNFAQRLSGIATLTRDFVGAVAGTGARIVDTRKTTPGLRLLEKYAVLCGGGANHRFGLDDMVLIKDNHIAVCGGIAEAVARARAGVGHAVKIEVECDTLDQVREAVEAAADIVLLDNMDAVTLGRAVELVAGRCLTEASGGIRLHTAAAVAASGVDIISVGALTHSAPALDIGLDIQLES